MILLHMFLFLEACLVYTFNWYAGAGFSNILREILSYEELLKHIFYLILKNLDD